MSVCPYLDEHVHLRSGEVRREHFDTSPEARRRHVQHAPRGPLPVVLEDGLHLRGKREKECFSGRSWSHSVLGSALQ